MSRDPIEVDIQRPDGVHRVSVRYDSGGIIDAMEMAHGLYCSCGCGYLTWCGDHSPRPFDLTTAEEDYFADKFLTQLAEDAADRRAEERGEKWG